MQKVTHLFSTLLRIFSIFLLSFIWAKYILNNLVSAILLSFFIVSIFEILRFIYLKKKTSYLSLRQEEKEKAEDTFLSLCTHAHPEEEIKNILSKTYLNIQKSKNCIYVTTDNKKTLFFIHNKLAPLSCDDILNIYTKQKSANKIVILCGKYQNDCVRFCNNLDIEFILLDQYETYEKIYKYQNCFPQITNKYKKEKSKTYKDFVLIAFNKRRSKYYFFSSIFLIFYSFLLPNTLYYSIFASILLILSIISQFNKKCNKTTAYSIFN